MNISAREKIMLIIIGILAILAGVYYFIYIPQMQKITDLMAEQVRIQVEVERTKAELASLGKLDEDIQTLDQKIRQQTQKFYPVMLQDKLIVILDGMIIKSEVIPSSSGFGVSTITQIQARQEKKEQTYPLKQLVGEYQHAFSEKLADTQSTIDQKKGTEPHKSAQNAQQLFESMTTTMQIKGSYEQLIAFVKEIEALNRTVVIKNLSLSGKTQENILSANIQIDFYALPKIHEQDQAYFTWPFENEYGKDNPFIE